MKPILGIVVITAIQEDIILTTMAMEITIQENLPFFKKSVGGGGKWINNQGSFRASSLSMSLDTFLPKKMSTH